MQDHNWKQSSKNTSTRVLEEAPGQLDRETYAQAVRVQSDWYLCPSLAQRWNLISPGRGRSEKAYPHNLKDKEELTWW